MTPAIVGVMTPQERDQKLDILTEDLEVSTAEWCDARDNGDTERSRRALSDMASIVAKMQETL